MCTFAHIKWTLCEPIHLTFSSDLEFVCVCVCVCVCVRACVRACMHARVCEYVRAYECMYVCTCVCVRAHIPVLFMFV